MPDIEVRQAEPGERVALENMFQLYVHDFSEQWWDRPYGELENNGRFGDDQFFDPYWEEQQHIPLLIRLDGNLVGFALLDASSHSGADVDRDMAEFFVVRKHRRGGVGTAAAHAIFTAYPGRWEAAVARRNTGALPFWRNAVATHPAVSDIEEVDVDSALWNGPVLRFRIGERR
ncbi:MAG TPA: GNAT family N-acetyltransferase [Caulobacteraceae bacterium]|nr:GNAT family N-acetyltransferase [Caulobacteraceae bacterium]